MGRSMKKTFPLQAPGKDDARVRDRIRQEVNKYVRRELRKPLPEGFDRWEFTCKVGATPDEAQARTLKEVGGAIDAVALAGGAQVHVEIVAAPQRREQSAG
jgi:Family of unknown function (DUF6172)